MATTRPKSVDEYLEGVSPPTARRSLEQLRTILLEEVPSGEELISYGIPTMKFHGYVASYAVFKRHCSFFPGHTVNEFADELKAYKTAKGTIQFPHDRPLPPDLVRRIIRSRVAEISASAKA